LHGVAACAAVAAPAECAAPDDPIPVLQRRFAAARPVTTRSQYALLRERRFAPFFWTQFLGAANDNVFKNAFVVFVTFHAASRLGVDAGMIVNLIGAVFILPFMVFSATSGQLADKSEKSALIRWIKAFEIAIMLIGLGGFALGSVTMLFVTLALLGVHSTLFGPVKYAILPQHLRDEELVGGNGMVEMGTFVAILLGTIAGGLAVAIEPNGPLLAAALTIVIAIAGWLASRRIPYTPPVAPALAINWNPATETWRNLAIARENVVVWRAMLGISWFWFYGAIYLAQLPAFTQRVLGGDEHVFTLLLALFSVGIGAGSLLCERLSGRNVEIGLVPFGSIGLTLFAVDLWLASRSLGASTQAGIGAFLAIGAHWRVAIDIVLIGVFGGFYTVPLYALLQARSQPSHRARIIAANNILNALFIIGSAAVAIGLLAAGVSIPALFLVVGVLNALVAGWIYALVPEFATRFIAWLLIRTVYRVRRRGLDHIPDDGPCIVVCNHVSRVDALIIAACVGRPIRFIIDEPTLRTPLLAFIFRSMRAIPIASDAGERGAPSPAFTAARAALAAGEIVGVFPEARIAPTGELGAFRPWVQQIAATMPVPVVPMAVRGLADDSLSPAPGGGAGRRGHRMFATIVVVAGAPMTVEAATPERLSGEVLALQHESR
jgi:1-acyl-sn-glycerol-3-phosphate acyltransferase